MKRSEVRRLARSEWRRQMRRLLKIMRYRKCHRALRHAIREMAQ